MTDALRLTLEQVKKAGLTASHWSGWLLNGEFLRDVDDAAWAEFVATKELPRDGWRLHEPGCDCEFCRPTDAI